VGPDFGSAPEQYLQNETMKSNLGITETHLKLIAEDLNKILADEVVLYTKVRNYHWNIQGEIFQKLHSLYEDQFRDIGKLIEQVADRLRVLSQHIEARLTDFLKMTNLIEQPYSMTKNDQLKNLMASHETIINNLRRLIPVFFDQYKDHGGSEFLTKMLLQHEKMTRIISDQLG
jgi:starvation-inducible DNA-binding protein